jgi:NDP-sugar pyrophosphorylase family protein
LGAAANIAPHWALNPAQAVADYNAAVVPSWLDGFVMTCLVVPNGVPGKRDDTMPRILRVNTIPAYKQTTKEILLGLRDAAKYASALSSIIIPKLAVETRQRTLEGARVVASALASVVPAGVVVEDSVVGPNVVLGDGCRIVRSVLLDGATIASGVTITDCLVHRHMRVFTSVEGQDVTRNLGEAAAAAALATADD